MNPDTLSPLAHALGGVILPGNEPRLRPPQGGILTLAPHNGGASVTLYYEGYEGDPEGVTSRPVWGRTCDSLPELHTVAVTLIARYQRNLAREVRLSLVEKFKDKQRP